MDVLINDWLLAAALTPTLWDPHTHINVRNVHHLSRPSLVFLLFLSLLFATSSSRWSSPHSCLWGHGDDSVLRAGREQWASGGGKDAEIELEGQTEKGKWAAWHFHMHHHGSQNSFGLLCSGTCCCCCSMWIVLPHTHLDVKAALGDTVVCCCITYTGSQSDAETCCDWRCWQRRRQESGSGSGSGSNIRVQDRCESRSEEQSHLKICEVVLYCLRVLCPHCCLLWPTWVTEPNLEIVKKIMNKISLNLLSLVAVEQKLLFTVWWNLKHLLNIMGP